VAKKPRPSQRGRSVRDYRRVEGTRQPRPAILIVCEGAATEPQYFKGLIEEWKLKTSVDIEVVGAGKQHITLVRRAIQLRDEREQADRKAKRAGQLAKPAYDEVWCVFDAEGDEAREAIARAVAMANDEGFKLAISNPAFEYWLLLHFEPTTRPFHTPRELRQKLKEHIPDYDKHLDFAILRSNIDAAIANAKAASTQVSDDFPNPSTGVHELVAALLEMVPFPR
jgi:hypothetical protein